MAFDDLFEDFFDRERHKEHGYGRHYHDGHHREHERRPVFGGRFCPDCGCNVQMECKFCPQCGTGLNAKRSYPGCSKETEPGAKFCSSCGTKLA